MSRHKVELWQSPDGRHGIGNRILSISANQKVSGAAIQSSLELLAEHGLRFVPGVRRLRHVEGAELYELKCGGKPPYRVLVMKMADDPAYVVLEIVARRDFTTHDEQEKVIDRCFDRMENWVNRQKAPHSGDERETHHEREGSRTLAR